MTVLYALFIAVVVVSAGMNWFPAAFVAARSFAGDKVLHFSVVGTLALLLNLSFESATCCESRCGAFLQWGSLIMFCIATVEEFSQLAIANRTFSLADLACNYLGIMILGSLPYFVRRRRYGNGR